MRYQFYREHKFVSSALNNLERAIAKADFCDEQSVKRIKEEFAALSDLLKGHAEYENLRLHALLKQKNCPASIYAHIEEDHDEQDKQLLEIEAMIQKIESESEKSIKIDLGYHLYLTFRKFVADNLAHLHEEETEILPALQKLYSDEELRQVEATTYQEMTPEQMIAMLQVLFPHMNPYDRQAFLLDILSLEPEKFEIVWQTMQHVLEYDERISLENRRKIQISNFSTLEKP